MFSDVGSPFGNDQLEAIIEGLKSLEIQLTLMWVFSLNFVSKHKQYTIRILCTLYVWVQISCQFKIFQTISILIYALS